MTRAQFVRWAALLAANLSCRSRTRARESAAELAITSVPRNVPLLPAWDFNGVIGTGQSLAVGANGTPLLPVPRPYHNLKLDLGSRFRPASEPDDPKLSLVSLCEPIRDLASRYPGPYPRNIFGQTPHTAMASQVTALFLEATSGAGDYVGVHSVVGESGQGIRALRKAAERTKDTGFAYAASLFETKAIARLARAAGRSFGVAAVVLTHGETDAMDPNYAELLLELARDYDADLRAITGQAAPILMLATQQSSCPVDAGARAHSALALLEASERAAERIVCVGPRYQYSYVSDGVHLDAAGYDRLGEKYGQVYFERVVRGRDWRPLRPRSVSRTGHVIDVEFHVPVPPLTWDPAACGSELSARREWSRGRGFELWAGETPLSIEEVSLQGNHVRLRFAGQPQGSLVLGYALSARGELRAGRSFRSGALRDSDPFVGVVSKQPQPNYAVTFERNVA
jgi:hypothetical protein